MQIKRIALGGIIMNVIMLVGVAQQSRTWQSGKKKRWKQEKQRKQPALSKENRKLRYFMAGGIHSAARWRISGQCSGCRYCLHINPEDQDFVPIRDYGR